MASHVEPPRWQYRFRNFSRAYSLLREAAADDPKRLNDLEREGLVRRFEYTFELAWKTLKDRLEHDGMRIEPIATARNVIRTAYESRLVADGQTWIDMLEDRNRMSHEYDAEAFQEVADNVHRRYLAVLEQLRATLAEEGRTP